MAEFCKMVTMPSLEILTPHWETYTLLDSGNRQKLESIGKCLLIRSEPKAWWEPNLAASEWAGAWAIHTEEGHWRLKRPLPESWQATLGSLTVSLRISEGSKHVGIFPEQEPNWVWLQEKLKTFQRSYRKQPRVLALFGYTGVATLLAASAGASVTHVDASKPAIAWARQNQALSGLLDAPIRWICDDAKKFIKRELKRGKNYDAIILDPPSFGRGPSGEIWKVERDLYPLLQDCVRLLSETPACMLLTLYSLDASAIMIKNLLDSALVSHEGKVQIGELAIPHHRRPQQLLPLSIFGRWDS